jgi:hypothetical protein
MAFAMMIRIAAEPMIFLVTLRKNLKASCDSGPKGWHILCRGRQAPERNHAAARGPEGRHINPNHIEIMEPENHGENHEKIKSRGQPTI